jgi:hypothetical protein
VSDPTECTCLPKANYHEPDCPLAISSDGSMVKGYPTPAIVTAARAVVSVWAEVEGVIAETTAPPRVGVVPIDDLARWRRLFVHLQATAKAIGVLKSELDR